MGPPLRSTFRVATIACLVALFAPATAWAQKVTLKLNLKAGETYTLTWTSRDQRVVSFGGIARKEIEATTVTMTLKPSKVDKDGTIHGVCTYNAIRIEGDGPDGKYTYDSASDKEVPAAPSARKYAAIVGRPLEVVVTSRGEVTTLTGAEEIPDAVIKSLNVPEDKRDAVEQAIRASAGNEGLKEALQQVIPQYPEKPIPARTVWKVEQKLSAVLPLTMQTVYGVKSLSDGKATLGMQSAMRTDSEADEAGSPARQFDLKGTEAGMIVVDQATGWIISGTLKRSLSGTLSMDAGALAASVPAKLQSEVTFGSPKKEPAGPGGGGLAPSAP